MHGVKSRLSVVTISMKNYRKLNDCTNANKKEKCCFPMHPWATLPVMVKKVLFSRRANCLASIWKSNVKCAILYPICRTWRAYATNTWPEIGLCLSKEQQKDGMLARNGRLNILWKIKSEAL